MASFQEGVIGFVAGVGVYHASLRATYVNCGFVSCLLPVRKQLPWVQGANMKLRKISLDSWREHIVATVSS